MQHAPLNKAIFGRASVALFVSLILLGNHGVAQQPTAVGDHNTELAKELESSSVPKLEQRLNSVDERLSTLAQYSLLSGVGAIGYRGAARSAPDVGEWFEIELEGELPVDQIVLIPTIMRNEQLGFVGNAFPDEVRIVIGKGFGDDKQEIKSFEIRTGSRQRIAPLVFALEQDVCSWVRIEVDRLPQRDYDKQYIFQFSEVMVFSGDDNVALGRPVSSSSNEPTGSPAWDQSFAVDGFVPYLMDSAQGHGNIPFISPVGIGERPTLTIDLGETVPISRINIHLVDQADTVPQSFTGDFGIPGLLKMEGAIEADFSNAKTLCQWKHENLFDSGPIKMFRFPETECRYVRFVVTDPYYFASIEQSGSRIGLAEIEVFSRTKNVALHKIIKTNFEANPPFLKRITDGTNRYGNILPIRNWLAELSERHDLEAEYPQIEAELNRRYHRQRSNLKWLIGLALFSTLITVASVFTARNLQQRAVLKTREQIAADLHDELGANFHAIGLISDLADASASDSEKVRPLLQRIRELTERSGKAATYCANMLESKGLYDNLIEDMKRTSARITTDLEYELAIEGEEHLTLQPRKRIGLFLFHQECLVNAIRHSGASAVKSDLRITPNTVNLKVTDNGVGLSPSQSPTIAKEDLPDSLKRRARLLGANIRGQTAEQGGLTIEITLPQKRGSIGTWFKKLFNR